MIRVEVAVAAVVSVAKLVEHFISRRIAQVKAAEVSDNIRLPATVDTPPAITLETENAESAVAGVVAALHARAAAFVMFALSRATMLLARAAGSELRASWYRTRV